MFDSLIHLFCRMAARTPARSLAVVLATALQAMPLLRTMPCAIALNSSHWAVVFRWSGVTSALLGAYDAVSGATTSVAQPYTVATTVGTAFSRRLRTQGHAAGTWSANPDPVAPGLILSLDGTISGTPTTAGTYTASITAWEFYLGGPSTTATFTFTVGGGGTAPAITTAPVSQTVPVGANVTLDVAAAGTMPLSYFWKLAGVNIPGETNATLQLKNVSSSSTGTYSITITNPYGSATASAIVTVIPPPSIRLQPVSQIVPQGTNVSLSVLATGSNVSFQWFLNGAILPNAINPALSLQAVTTAQSGLYSVLVSNAAGTLTSSNAHILVVPPPNLASIPPLIVTLTRPSSVTLSCTIDAGYGCIIESTARIGTNLWTVLTNAPASFSSFPVTLQDATANSTRRFYRLRLQGP